MAYRLILAAVLPVIGMGAVGAQDALPDGEGRDIVEYVCTQCHDLLPVTSARKTHEQWRYLVVQMINQGAPLEDYEVEPVVRYLADNFGQ